MAKFSKELIDKLCDFLIHEIDVKILEGITYAFVLKDPKYKKNYERYKSIKDEVLKCGYRSDEIFRIFEVNNGYIFDMDLGVGKQITREIFKSVAASNGGKVMSFDELSKGPSERRNRDIKALAGYVNASFKDGKDTIEVALFNRNTVPRIIVVGSGTDGKNMAIKYNAYALRPLDLTSVNELLIKNCGVRIAKAEPCEILPSKTGVRFVLYLERVDN